MQTALWKELPTTSATIRVGWAPPTIWFYGPPYNLYGFMLGSYFFLVTRTQNWLLCRTH